MNNSPIKRKLIRILKELKIYNKTIKRFNADIHLNTLDILEFLYTWLYGILSEKDIIFFKKEFDIEAINNCLPTNIIVKAPKNEMEMEKINKFFYDNGFVWNSGDNFYGFKGWVSGGGKYFQLMKSKISYTNRNINNYKILTIDELIEKYSLIRKEIENIVETYDCTRKNKKNIC